MSLPIRLLAVSLTFALLGAAGVAAAMPGPAASQDPQPQVERQAPPPQARAQRPRQPRQERRQEADPLSDSIRRIERRTRGQVISAERVPYDGRAVSRVKVVDDQGRVRIYMDDPQSPPADPRTRRDDD